MLAMKHRIGKKSRFDRTGERFLPLLSEATIQLSASYEISGGRAVDPYYASGFRGDPALILNNLTARAQCLRFDR
jgi:hypothetical protein